MLSCIFQGLVYTGVALVTIWCGGQVESSKNLLCRNIRGAQRWQVDDIGVRHFGLASHGGTGVGVKLRSCSSFPISAFLGKNGGGSENKQP